MKLQELTGKSIAILGFGREGKSTLRFLLGLGVTDIAILDSNPNLTEEVHTTLKENNVILSEGNESKDPLYQNKEIPSQELEIGMTNASIHPKIKIIGASVIPAKAGSSLKNISISQSGKCRNLNNDPVSSTGGQYFSALQIIGGENYLDNLGAYDIIIKTPGISPYHEKIALYREKLTSQTEIFFANYLGKVIGITGTKGKSTTTSLTHEVIQKAGYTSKLVGNIGTPVLDEVDILSCHSELDSESGKDRNTNYDSVSGTEGCSNYDFVVYELSSYMLENFEPPCYIGVLINIYPDHLNWHGNSFEQYTKAKKNILKQSTHTIFGPDVQSDAHYESLLPGEHNQHNIQIVAKIAEIIGIPEEVFRAAVSTFQPLPHRLQNIGTYDEITFIDDAISTTPESTIEALKTYGSRVDTIFLGGTDRGYDFTELIQVLITNHIHNIVLFPESGAKILSLLNKERNQRWSILETSSMQEAVDFAFTHTKKGSICLLSCASPSYSLWKNYEEKGEKFKEAIQEYISLS